SYIGQFGRGFTVDNKTYLLGNRTTKPESHRIYPSRDTNTMPGNELWNDGLICAFEFIRGQNKSTNPKPGSKTPNRQHINGDNQSRTEQRASSVPSFDDDRGSPVRQPGQVQSFEKYDVGSHWVPIGWSRISELVQTVQVDDGWASQLLDSMDDEYNFTVAELAAPYWERPAGPVWWCHVSAGHPSIDSWLGNAQWLHPAISLALRDESKLISEKMKHLLYELLGQSAGDPFIDEDDIPVVLRSWQAQNFLVTVLHLKGPVSNINVLGITEVQEFLSAGGYNTPRTVHEIIAHLTSRLTRWDDRLFRKSIFGAADEIELKFMNRRNQEDMNLFSVILNQEIRKLSRQVIRVKWSLHAREEIVFELLQHLKGNTTRILLEGIRKSTREMIEEQEAVRVLSIITGLFGINVDGIPGAQNTPYAFGLFAAILFGVGIILIIIGLIYLGLKQPITEAQVRVRKMELQELVKMFQHEAETHAQLELERHGPHEETVEEGDNTSHDTPKVIRHDNPV
ncbi:hypothetical protein G4B88_031127, partial [Cannabis sativa]